MAWKLYHNGREKWFRPGKLGLFCQLKSLPDCFHDSDVYIKNCPKISNKKSKKWNSRNYNSNCPIKASKYLTKYRIKSTSIWWKASILVCFLETFDQFWERIYDNATLEVWRFGKLRTNRLQGFHFFETPLAEAVRKNGAELWWWAVLGVRTLALYFM